MTTTGKSSWPGGDPARHAEPATDGAAARFFLTFCSFYVLNALRGARRAIGDRRSSLSWPGEDPASTGPPAAAEGVAGIRGNWLCSVIFARSSYPLWKMPPTGRGVTAAPRGHGRALTQPSTGPAGTGGTGGNLQKLALLGNFHLAAAAPLWKTATPSKAPLVNSARPSAGTGSAARRRALEQRMDRRARRVLDVVVQEAHQELHADDDRKRCGHDRAGGRHHARFDARQPP
jgi:hypothetical protein